MFKIVMVTAAILVVLGWVAYGVWRVVSSYMENKPRQSSKRLREARKSVDEYAQKLGEYDYKKKPPGVEEKGQ